jgi:mono/diheme cytochrome c family protein
VANAIDDSTDRANQSALTQTLWQQGCGGDNAGSRCRASALAASLQYAFTAQRSYDMQSPQFIRDVSDVLAHNRNDWVLANPDLPNRDPLAASATNVLEQLNVSAALDPLTSRAPLRIVNAGDNAGELVKGLSTFWSMRALRQLDQALSTHSTAPIREQRAACTYKPSQDGFRFQCAPATRGRGSDEVSLLGTVTSRDVMLDEIRVGKTMALRNLTASLPQQISRHVRFTPKGLVGSIRLPDGRAVEAIELRHANALSGEASVYVRDDFSAAASMLSSAQLQSAPVSAQHLDALMTALRTGEPMTCCVDTANVRSPGLDAPLPVSAAAAPYQAHCGGCHNTNQSAPPNFLAGDDAQVRRALNSCAPRMHVRLAMQDVPSSERLKTPMPPDSAATEQHASGTLQRVDLDALRQRVAELLRAEFGRAPSADELLRKGYEQLRPCLPQPRRAA